MLSDHQRSTAQISLLERTGCVRREAVGIVAADAASLGEGLVEVGDIGRGLVVLGGRMLVPAHTPRESLGLRKEGLGRRSRELLGDLAHPFEVESPRLHRLEMVPDELLAAGGVGKAAVQELLQLQQ